MVCQCSGTGVPLPSVFWTKQPNTTIIGTGSTYERDLISKDVDGKYNCHLKNLLKEVISTTGFYHYGKNLICITDNRYNMSQICRCSLRPILEGGSEIKIISLDLKGFETKICYFLFFVYIEPQNLQYCRNTKLQTRTTTQEKLQNYTKRHCMWLMYVSFCRNKYIYRFL